MKYNSRDRKLDNGEIEGQKKETYSGLSRIVFRCNTSSSEIISGKHGVGLVKKSLFVW